MMEAPDTTGPPLFTVMIAVRFVSGVTYPNSFAAMRLICVCERLPSV